MLTTTTSTHHGHTINEYRLRVPIDHTGQSTRFAGQTISIYAREIVPPGGEHWERLVYLQGGPGGMSPRQPDLTSGWMGHALKQYRVVLLDQRGTGNSTPVDLTTPEQYPDAQALADYIGYMRADQIIYDAEALRAALQPGHTWTTLGQSYGGFLTLAYLSMAPEGLTHCMITGGLPAIGVPLEELYRTTYRLTAEHNASYAQQYPQVIDTMRKVCAHLDRTVELLPTGHRLTSERLRTVGIQLGMQSGRDALQYFFEQPFAMVNGHQRLTSRFLDEAAHRLNRYTNPLFALIHEPIYAGLICAPEDCTNWVANRVRTEDAQVAAGFAKDADPTDASAPYMLTGEHIYPWEFDQDPALIPFANAAHILAARTDWPELYNLERLQANTVPVEACVYMQDMFVPAEYSLHTATLVGNCAVWRNEEDEHDAVRHCGDKVIVKLMAMMAARSGE